MTSGIIEHEQKGVTWIEGFLYWQSFGSHLLMNFGSVLIPFKIFHTQTTPPLLPLSTRPKNVVRRVFSGISCVNWFKFTGTAFMLSSMMLRTYASVKREAHSLISRKTPINASYQIFDCCFTCEPERSGSKRCRACSPPKAFPSRSY